MITPISAITQTSTTELPEPGRGSNHSISRAGAEVLDVDRDPPVVPVGRHRNECRCAEGQRGDGDQRAAFGCSALAHRAATASSIGGSDTIGVLKSPRPPGLGRSRPGQPGRLLDAFGGHGVRPRPEWSSSRPRSRGGLPWSGLARPVAWPQRARVRGSRTARPPAGVPPRGSEASSVPQRGAADGGIPCAGWSGRLLSRVGGCGVLCLWLGTRMSGGVGGSAASGAGWWPNRVVPFAGTPNIALVGGRGGSVIRGGVAVRLAHLLLLRVRVLGQD